MSATRKLLFRAAEDRSYNLGVFPEDRTYKPSKPGSVGFVGATPASIPKIDVVMRLCPAASLVIRRKPISRRGGMLDSSVIIGALPPLWGLLWGRCVRKRCSARRPWRDANAKPDWFHNLIDARTKIRAWHEEYNGERPHSSLGGRTPNEFAAIWNPQL